MLSPEHRLHRPADFNEVVRRGRRNSRPLLTVHALLAARGSEDPTDVAVGHPADQSFGPPRAGLVVSKAVGGSVVRHRSSRRLRHLLRTRLPDLPAGARIVVRAAPGAGTASSCELANDLDAARAGALRPRPAR